METAPIRFRNPATEPAPVRQTGKFVAEYKWLGMVRNMKLKDLMSPTEFRLYWVLYAYIIRGEIKDDNLFRDYYKNGKLAASVGLRHIRKLTGLAYDTIINNLNSMEAKGIIEQKKVKTVSRKKKDIRERTVFILGYIIYGENTTEVLFLEDLLQ